MSYTNIFGGSVVQPSEVMYIKLTLTAGVQLSWPTQYVANPATPYVIAQNTEITTNGVNYLIAMPAANQVSVGMYAMIRNIGSNVFTITDTLGNQIIQIPTGEAWYIYITDNTTVQGTWGIIQQGAGTSEADATSLAGSGLIPLTGKLNTYIPPEQLTTTYLASDDDLAKLFYWNGGTGDFFLPAGNTIPLGFYLSINNTLTGSLLTVESQDLSTIDNQSAFQLNPGESSTFIWLGNAQWVSLGYGKSNIFGATINVMNISASGTITLTPTQASRSIQQFVGTLISNTTIVFPNVLFQKIVNNATNGAFTLTLSTATPTQTVVIPQNQIINIYCDGNNNIYSVPTIIPAEGILFGDGSVSTPSITFATDTSTGFYHPSAGAINFTSSAHNALQLTSNQLLPYGVGTAAVPNYSYFGHTNTGLYYNNTNSTQNLTLNGSDSIVMASNLITLTTNANITGSLTLSAALAIADGGTGNTNKAAAFNALSPITSNGDLIVGSGVNSAARLPASNITQQYLQTVSGPGITWGYGPLLQTQQTVYTNTTNTLTNGSFTYFQCGLTTLSDNKIYIQIQINAAVQVTPTHTPKGSINLIRTINGGPITNLYFANSNIAYTQASMVISSSGLQSSTITYIDSGPFNIGDSVIYYLIGAADVNTTLTVNYSTASLSSAPSSIVLMEIGV